MLDLRLPQRRSRTAFSVVIVFLLLTQAADAVAVERLYGRDGDVQREQAPDKCNVDGDPDLYGFGVRLGKKQHSPP